MEWFIAAVAVAALGVAAMAAAGGMGEMSDEPVYDVYRQDLPGSALTADDLERVRFGVTLRGYAMSQVDDLLERLGREIAERDARIAALTAPDGDRDVLQPVGSPPPAWSGPADPLDPPAPSASPVSAPADELRPPEADGSHRVGRS